MAIPRLGLPALTGFCLCLLAVGVVADNLPWLAGLRTAIQRTPSRYPSSVLPTPAELARFSAVLSVYADPEYLTDPDYGLLTNPTRRGRDWEHPATVSYFENGRLLFASPVGLRLHGATSRIGSPVKSFRLYFRREYGAPHFRAKTLFGGAGDPLTRLVALNDLRLDHRGRWWHLVNPLAFDIARRIGALAPETQAVSFMLNGTRQGLYVLTEHVRKPFLVARFGHDHFDRADSSLRQRWLNDVAARPVFTMADAATWIDVESLTRWFVAVVFCGTSDPYQAVVYRDRTDPRSRWFWVSWDMDHSFMDFYRRAHAPWRHDTFAATIGPRTLEARIIRRLINDDPLYRDYLADVFLEALNYRLTPSFLSTRFRHYRSIATRHGVEEDYLEILAQFLRFRAMYVRGMLRRHLDVPPLHRVHVDGPRGTRLRINGHPIAPGFIGWYPRGAPIDVELVGNPDGLQPHWSVDGRPMGSSEVRQRVRSDTEIRVEFPSGRDRP